MTDLNDNLKRLKDDYRTFFNEAVKDIASALENISLSQKKSYLENRLNSLKLEKISYLKELRSSYSCSGCGVCCRFAVSEFSYDELKQKAQNGDKYASQFVSIFIPYNSTDEYKDIFPQYLELLEGNKYYVYHCPKVTSDNKCPDYANRPQICRDFPDNPIAFLHPDCGFMDWKLKSEPVWLKLRAEIEIINYYLENI